MGGFCNEVRCIMKKENNAAHNHNRGSFSGRIGYVLAVAGSAVGLGISGDFRILQRNMEAEFSC